MNIKTEKNMLRLSFPYDKGTIKLCHLLDMKFSKQKEDWFFKDNLMNRCCMNRVFPGLIPDSGNREIKELVVPSFLMDHQGRTLRTAARRDRHGIYHDTGTGKTLTALEIYRHHKVKTLVICPLSLIEGAWFNEIRDRYPDIEASNLWAAKKRSPIAFNRALEKDLCVINYESFRTVDKKLGGAGFDMVILDESARIRSPKNLSGRILKGRRVGQSTAGKIIEFCDDVRYVYELSGVPAPNSMLDYWMQIRILDPLLWGKSYYKFRTKYFYPSGYGGYDWKVKPEFEKKLMDDIKTVAEYVSKDDVLDLPERTDSMRIFQLSPDERKHYKNIKTELVTILDDGEAITSPSAVTAIMKLRQLSSGFLLDDGSAHDIGGSKLNEFKALIEDIGPKQVIVWINFKYEAVQVAKALGETGLESGVLNSTVAEKQKQEYLNSFKRGDLQYIVCHPLSVGFGHTLVNCSDAIYYSSSYSYDESHQSRDRIYRKGQVNKCSYYYLLADKTLDLPILNAVRSKEKTSKAVLQWLKN
jgi:SNF2 family DNA or RNA helicase